LQRGALATRAVLGRAPRAPPPRRRARPLRRRAPVIPWMANLSIAAFDLLARGVALDLSALPRRYFAANRSDRRFAMKNDRPKLIVSKETVDVLTSTAEFSAKGNEKKNKVPPEGGTVNNCMPTALCTTCSG